MGWLVAAWKTSTWKRCKKDNGAGRTEAEKLVTLGGQGQCWVGGGSGEHAARLAMHVNSGGSHKDDVWNKTFFINHTHC